MSQPGVCMGRHCGQQELSKKQLSLSQTINLFSFKSPKKKNFKQDTNT